MISDNFKTEKKIFPVQMISMGSNNHDFNLSDSKCINFEYIFVGCHVFSMW